MTANFSYWPRLAYGNPMQFTSLTRSLVLFFREKNCLLARKFPDRSVTLETWLACINANEDDGYSIIAGEEELNRQASEWLAKEEGKRRLKHKRGDDGDAMPRKNKRF